MKILRDGGLGVIASAATHLAIAAAKHKTLTIGNMAYAALEAALGHEERHPEVAA